MGAVVTDGLQVAELGRMLGLRLDGRDRETLETIFEVNAAGSRAQMDVWVTGSGQRVRRVLLAACLGWLFLTQEKRAMWSAPTWAEAADEFDQLRTLLTDPANHRSGIVHQVRSIRAHSGVQEIETVHDTRLLFRGRQGSAHKGYALTRLILEGHVTPQELGSLMPCLAGQRDPQYLVTLVNEEEPAAPPPEYGGTARPPKARKKRAAG